MDVISINTGNTKDKTLSCYLRLFTTYKNDSISVNYGDSNIQYIKFNSGILRTYNFKLC